MQQVQASQGLPLEIEVLRNGESLIVSVTPQERHSVEEARDADDVRQFHPGIIIDRNSNSEDAHTILEQALKAAGMDPSSALRSQNEKSFDNSTFQQYQQQLEELNRQLQLLTARIAALEQQNSAPADNSDGQE